VEYYGKEATEANKRLVDGKNVELEPDVQVWDKYGRMLAYVWVDDVMVNEELVRQGHARVSTYPPNVTYQERFCEAEREARQESRGQWADNPAIKAEQQGEAKASEREPKEAAPFVASKKSKAYHRASCPFAEQIKPENLIEFKSEEEAKASGMRGCSRCVY
jgi:micrococcal nuclease